MNLRSLEYFVIVAEELSFTRGALRAHIEQPPLSQAIRRLESQLGIKLFDRSTRGIKLTMEGENFLPTARHVLQTYSNGLKAAKALRKPAAGTLRVGYVAAAAFGVLPGLIKDLKAQAPAIELDLQQIDSEEQVDLIGAGELDGGLIRPRQLPEKFGRTKICREPFVCVVSTQHRFATRKDISMQDLRDEPFVSLPAEPPTHFHTQIAKLFSEAGLKPNVVQQTRLFTTIVGLVSANLGLSIVPASVAAIDISGVRFLGIRDVSLEAGMDFIWLRDPSSPLLALMERFALQLNRSQ